MPQPRNILYQVRGSLPGGERWSNTLHFDDGTSGPFSGLDLAAAVEQVKTRYHGFLQSTNGFPSTCTVDSVGGYVYDDAGALVEIAQSGTSPLAGTGSVTRPHQVAVVASLLTGIPSGRTRGRLYLPLLSAPITPDSGRISSTTTQLVANELSECLTDLRAAGYDVANDALTAVVVSTTYQQATPINQIRVGNVFDTQRRRRDALVEAYVTAAYPSA